MRFNADKYFFKMVLTFINTTSKIYLKTDKEGCILKKQTLTAEEKKRRRQETNRRYYERLKQRAKSGDENAQKQRTKNRHSANFGAAKSFIKKEATQQEISELRDYMAARVTELRKNKKDK